MTDVVTTSHEFTINGRRMKETDLTGVAFGLHPLSFQKYKRRTIEDVVTYDFMDEQERLAKFERRRENPEFKKALSKYDHMVERTRIEMGLRTTLELNGAFLRSSGEVDLKVDVVVMTQNRTVECGYSFDKVKLSHEDFEAVKNIFLKYV